MLFTAFNPLVTAGVLVLWLLNPGHSLRLNIGEYAIQDTTQTQTQHITSYGTKAVYVETWYVFIRDLMNAQKINQHITVYKALPKFPTGAIGSMCCNGKELYYYSGIYQHDEIMGTDVIITDGRIETIIHELIHFFYHYLPSYQREEMLVRHTTNYIVKMVNETIEREQT